MKGTSNSSIPKNEDTLKEFYKLAEEFSFDDLTVTAGDRVERFFDLYKIQYGIGKGGFAIVVAAEHLNRNETCAIKIIRKHNNMGFDSSMLHEEASILKSLNHPNIIKYIEVHETEELFFIVTEIMEGGSLSSYYYKRIQEGKLITEEEIRLIMKQIFEGVRYIHSSGIMHRDIKLENILLKFPEDLDKIKIIDFGIGSKVNLNTTFCDKAKYGTFLYMAPEQIKNNICIPISDLWSCGIMTFLLISGRFPFFQSHNEENEDSILEKMSKPVKFPNNTSILFKDLFHKLCTIDPLKRCSAEEALHHPFITNKNEPIPLTFNEQIAIDEQLEQIKRVLFLIIFISNNLYKLNYLENLINPKNLLKKKVINVPKITIFDSNENKELKNENSKLPYSKTLNKDSKNSFMRATSSSKNFRKDVVSENIYKKDPPKPLNKKNSSKEIAKSKGSKQSLKNEEEEEEKGMNITNKRIHENKLFNYEEEKKIATPKMNATLNQFIFNKETNCSTPKRVAGGNLILKKSTFSKLK